MKENQERETQEREEEVKRIAKKIMDEFMEELGKVKLEEEFGVERNEMFREPDQKSTADPEFRQRMLKNAAKVKDDCIVAEKKSW
ncbi:MAG: hypothetical protein V1743_03215 [Nanoarchaeota archaeon]